VKSCHDLPAGSFLWSDGVTLFRTGYPEAVKLACAMYAISVVMAQSQPDSLRSYKDPQNRFQFTYPAEFGTPGPGTDTGFRNRTAAIRRSAGRRRALRRDHSPNLYGANLGDDSKCFTGIDFG
jgi:hypothetical protein